MNPQRQPIARSTQGAGHHPASISVSRKTVEEFRRPAAQQRNEHRRRAGGARAVKSSNAHLTSAALPLPGGEGGRWNLASPSTYRLNRSNVKRKPGARRAGARKKLWH
jgi:hypothetical protein